MIRLVQRKLILPRGDTGSFTIPVLPDFNTGDIAVFAIFNPLNKTIVFKKQVEIINQKITIQFSHNETVNLPAGKYLWDIKAYLNPEYADGELVNGDQIDSYYAGYKLPECQIRQTSDNYLLADDAPTSTLSSAQLDIISAALAQLRDAVQKSQKNVSHYPVIINEEWYTWNTDTNQYVGTGVRVPARISDLIDDSGHYIKPANGIPANDIADGVIPDISVKADKVLNATNGNFASLDANGNLVDSGHKHSDYLTEHQDISGKQDILTFDNAPQLLSDNPVKSSGLWNAFNSVNNDITFINSQISSLQNQVIGKQDLLYFDTQPKANSNHPVTSGGIKTAIDTAISTKQDTLTFDTIPTQSSNNPVTSGGIKSALSGLEWSLSERANMIDGRVDDLQNNIAGHTMDISLLESNITDLETNKQDKLTFDNTPTANSTNPVTSGGVYRAITNIKTMGIHICTSQEYNSQTGIPTVASPDTKTFYLVPGGEGNNLYIEWVYVNNAWQQFGSATIDLSGYALLSDIPSNVSEFTNDAGYLTQHQDITGKQDVLTFDNVPTINSTNPVVSNGIYTAINNVIKVQETQPVDPNTKLWIHETNSQTVQVPTVSEVEDMISNAGYLTQHQDISGKQDTLTFDSTPTQNSINPVTSNGIKVALDLKANISSIPTKVSDLDNDSGYLTSHQDITGKTDKVANATNGNFAALDANGNLTDSGSKASDFLTTHQDISGKADKVTSATNGNFAALDSNGNLADSGHKHSDYLTSHQDISGKADKVTSATNGNFAALDANGNLTDSGHKHSDYLTSHQTIPVTDVQLNGTSVLNNGVANVPIASSSTFGVMKTNTTYGLNINGNGELYTLGAGNAHIKTGDNLYRPITPGRQHQSVFYGLAKAAGDTTQSASENEVGVYTETARSKIHEMLDAPVTVSGTDPVIACKAGIQYVCGEVSTLSITLPVSGIVDIIFESGSTPTVLSGLSGVNWANGFDPTSLDTNATYELNVKGSLGVAVKWT